MRRLNFTILIAMLMAVGTLVKAQDTIRHLVISECRVDNWTHAYAELTNMSETETVDLSEFYYGIMRDNAPQTVLIGDEVYFTPGQNLWSGSSMKLSGMLAPGESYLIMSVQDVIRGQDLYPTPVHSTQMVEERADTVIHFNDWGGGDRRFRTWPLIPKWEMWGFDSISSNRSVVFNRHNDAPALVWHSGDTSFVLVDQALGTMAWGEDGVTGNYINETDPPKSVAGVPSAHDEWTLVRKFSVKRGETNWALAAGSSPATSSWMLIPSNKDFDHMCYETEGYHGDFHLDYSSTVYDIDESAGTITVPWGTEKHDSIRLGLTLGMGMAWDYVEQASFEDSLSTVCNTGDTLILYCTGTELEEVHFRVIVADPTDDMVMAFPRNTINYPDPDDPDYQPTDHSVVGSVIYAITKGRETDSIYEIPYATPIDTFLMLMDIAPNATAEFVWASGMPSSELSWGDKFRITGGDGTTVKEYHLGVAEYEPADNTDLKAITWPDRPAGFMEGWKGDTIPLFNSKATSYFIPLPAGTMTVPSLVIELDDINASYTVDRAVSLKGSVDERTTTINITSESDTLFSTVKIVFEVFNPTPQKYVADPVFAKFVIRDWWSAGGMEILNASDELIDLSEYMIVKSNEINYADAVSTGWETDSSSWLTRWKKAVLGYKWESFESWSVEPGKLIIDAAIDPFVEPKDVKSFWVIHPSGDSRAYWNDIDPAHGGRADYIVNNDDFDPGVFYNPWGEPINRESTFAFPLYPRAGQGPTSNYYMLKILNDSVRAGTKAADDPADFEVVDVWGSPIVPWVVNGRIWTSPPGESYSCYRKADKYWGVTELGANFGNEDSSHYTLRQDYEQNPQARTYNQREFGNHPLDPITGHLSIVTSLIYDVSRGFVSDQTIGGVSRGEDVAAFLANIGKADPTQTLAVFNAGEKASDATIIDNDTLVVTSQTGNVTRYVISTAALDGDNVLVPVDGSGVTVDVSGVTGTVGGFALGTTIKGLLENLQVPSLAILTVIDEGGNLVPMQMLNNDTMYVDVVVSQDYQFEVTAENGDIITYDLAPAVGASDAMVVSDLYSVLEEPVKVIFNIDEGTTVRVFMENIVASEGATVRILIKSGQERVDGQLNYDDVLAVTSSDGTVTVVYILNFLKELAAFVTSDVFAIDQLAAMISVPENTTVESLVAGLAPAPQAVITVYDVDQNVKTTGTVLDTDVVTVVSGDGRSTVNYSITVIVSVFNNVTENLSVYPNPAQDVLYVKNIPADTQVRISDITGRIHLMQKASDISHGIDLAGMQKGLYFLTVEKDGRAVATVKFVKR